MIDVDKAFILHGLMKIDYDGRAKSTVGPGNFLVTKKIDNTILIHSAEKITPMNYIGSKTTIHIDDNRIICQSKTETIIITIHKINFYKPIEIWSSSNIKMSKTEQQLVDHIERNIEKITGILENDIEQMHKEVPVATGKIDLLVIEKNQTHHIIEVKRGKATTNAIYQVKKYIDYIDAINSKGYILSPEIGKNALKFCKEFNYKWIKVEHS